MTTTDRRRTRSLSSVFAAFIVASTLLSVTSTVIAALALDRVGQRAASARALIEVTQRSRLKSAEVSCRETEAIKRSIRTVLSEQLPPAELQRSGVSQLFVRFDCHERARALVKPLPPLPDP